MRLNCFTDKEFYPADKKGNSGLDESLKKGSPIFSYDVGNRGAKRFFACGYERFLQLYEIMCTNNDDDDGNKKKPSIYEVLLYDLPTKLFFDIDAKKSKFKDLENVISDFLYHCLDELTKLLKIQFSPKDIIILTASTSTKHSYHIIIQHFLVLRLDKVLYSRLRFLYFNLQF